MTDAIDANAGDTTLKPEGDQPDAVLLIHGTFSFRERDEMEEATWWWGQGDFASTLNGFFQGRATCWPGSVCRQFPWKEPGSGRLGPFSGRDEFCWSGLNSEVERRRAASRLLAGLRSMEAIAQPYHLIGHSYGGTLLWYALLESERSGRPLCAVDGPRSFALIVEQIAMYRTFNYREKYGVNRDLEGLKSISARLRGNFLDKIEQIPYPKRRNLQGDMQKRVIDRLTPGQQQVVDNLMTELVRTYQADD